MKDSEALKNCTFSKTVLMFAIIIYHTLSTVCKENGFARILTNWLSSFQNYAFFLISGYIFSFIRFECHGYDKLGTFLIKKTKRLLIPYVSVLFLWVIPVDSMLFCHSPSVILHKFICGTNPDQLHFILELFEVFVVAWVITEYFNKTLKNEKYIICLLIICYFVGAKCQDNFPNVFRLFSAMQMLVFFYIGILFRRNSISLNSTQLWFAVALHLTLLYISKSAAKDNTCVDIVLQFAVNLLGAISAFSILQRIAEKGKWKESTTISFLSERSMPVYLFHQQIIYLLNSIKIEIDGSCAVAIIMFLTILLSLLLSNTILKLKFGRIITGCEKS